MNFCFHVLFLQVIEFYKPLTLIVGHNGAGKTVRGQGRYGAWGGVVRRGGAP